MEALPRDELLVCHTLHKFTERLNTMYSFWEFSLTGLSVPVHENSAKPRASRSMHIVNEGIANHEYFVGGRHSRDLEQFKKKVPRWFPETTFGGHHTRLEIFLP